MSNRRSVMIDELDRLIRDCRIFLKDTKNNVHIYEKKNLENFVVSQLYVIKERIENDKDYSTKIREITYMIIDQWDLNLDISKKIQSVLSKLDS
jgi:hypothetical protein